MSFKSPCLHRVVHLLPRLEVCGQALFVRDLSVSVPGTHCVVTLSDPSMGVEVIDKVFAGYGVSVFYADNKKFSVETVRALGGTHVIFHDVVEADLTSVSAIAEEFPSLYYGYYQCDRKVDAGHWFVSDPLCDETAEVLAPGVDRAEVRKSMQRKPTADRTGVGLLFGSLRSYDAALVTDCVHSLDLTKYYLMVSDPTPLADSPGIDETLAKLKEEKLGTRCPMAFGNTPNYLNYCRVMIDTGCRRINAEAGAAEIPLLPRCRTAKEIQSALDRFSSDKEFQRECSERSRVAARENDIRITSVSIRNKLFDVRV